MNASIRCSMAAGVAALGAATLAIAPITQPDVLPSAKRIAANAQLAAWVNPLTPVFATVNDVGYYLFDQYNLKNIYQNPERPGPFKWPDYFSGSSIPDGGMGYTYAPLNAGIVPDFLNQFSTGALSAVGNNIAGLGYAAFNAVATLGQSTSQSVWNFPATVSTAVQDLIAGDPNQALLDFLVGIVGPFRDNLNALIADAGVLLEQPYENVQIVLKSFLPRLAKELVADSLVPGMSALAKTLVNTAQTVFQDLAGGQFEAAWNAGTLGLLGSEGTLGQAISLTIGIGIQQDVAGVSTITIPSLRAVLTSELQRLGGSKNWRDSGIRNPSQEEPDYYVGRSAASPARALAAASENDPPETAGDGRSRVRGSHSTPASGSPTTPAADDSASGSSESSTVKPAKRMTRAAAKAGAAAKAHAAAEADAAGAARRAVR